MREAHEDQEEKTIRQTQDEVGRLGRLRCVVQRHDQSRAQRDHRFPPVLSSVENQILKALQRYIPFKGLSMWPWLLPGDRLLCRYDDLPPKKGDIVLSRLDGRMIVHRVIATDPVRLKGDRAVVADPPDLPVLARVVGWRRGEQEYSWQEGRAPGRRIAVWLAGWTTTGESRHLGRRLARWLALVTYWLLAKRMRARPVGDPSLRLG